MPVMEPRERDGQHAQDALLMQARRNVCSTLRRALRRIRGEEEEQICLDALSFDNTGHYSWRMLDRLVANIQQIDDPDLLYLMALDAPSPRLQNAALRRLLYERHTSDPRTQRVLDELSCTLTNERLLKRVSRLRATNESEFDNDEDSAFWDTRRGKKSILNPHLPALCASGAVDPNDVEERKLIEYVVHAQGHGELSYLLPDDRLTDHIERWWRDRGTTYLLAREDDLDALENYVLFGSDEQTRTIAFSRLTGFWHWERCDAFSHVTYGCTPVDSYDQSRALRLCEMVLATTEPDSPWHDPTPPIDALREGARQVTEHIRYGRVFWNDLTGVGEYARAVAARLRQVEGIEHWLLGCLNFCATADDDFRSSDAPYIDVIDAIEDKRDAQQLLAMRSIDAGRLSRALTSALADGGKPEHENLLSYFDAAQRYAWHGEPGALTVTCLLKVILRYPTGTICRALNRLALIGVLNRTSQRMAG